MQMVMEQPPAPDGNHAAGGAANQDEEGCLIAGPDRLEALCRCADCSCCIAGCEAAGSGVPTQSVGPCLGFWAARGPWVLGMGPSMRSDAAAARPPSSLQPAGGGTAAAAGRCLPRRAGRDCAYREAALRVATAAAAAAQHGGLGAGRLQPAGAGRGGCRQGWRWGLAGPCMPATSHHQHKARRAAMQQWAAAAAAAAAVPAHVPCHGPSLISPMPMLSRPQVGPQRPLPPGFDSPAALAARLHSLLEGFEEAPFTLQRLCEVLLEPRKQYGRLEKWVSGGSTGAGRVATCWGCRSRVAGRGMHTQHRNSASVAGGAADGCPAILSGASAHSAAPAPAAAGAGRREAADGDQHTAG